MNRKQLITEVNDLLETYCDGCFLQKHFRKEHSKYYAHSFCIRQCTIGEKLQKYGKQLQ
ncbi:zinc-finger domain-containing protein [Bacillus sp. NPDC077411]|uniref:Zinc-finger domain-containing protein n=1 Tax=Bacillus bruguierae TaxID=3127667 RepID=A0ABU8FDW6_9BACI